MQRLPKLKIEKTMQKWLDWNALSPKELLRKFYVSVVVIGSSVIHGLRRYPIVWRTFFHDIKLLTWELEENELKMFYGALTI